MTVGECQVDVWEEDWQFSRFIFRGFGRGKIPKSDVRVEVGMKPLKAFFGGGRRTRTFDHSVWGVVD